MSNAPFPGWQTNASDASFSEPVECARRISKFERSIRIRNVIEYCAGVLVTVLFGGTAIGAFIKGEALIGLAAVAIVAGAWVALWNLRSRASNLVRRPEDACLAHLRRQYRHQQAALAAVPNWYIGPMLPGVALFYFAITRNVAEIIGWKAALAGIAGPAAITFGIFALVMGVNWLAARGLQRKIDNLDALA